MLWAEADDHVAKLGKVHRRRAEKSGDESVSGIVIDIGGSTELSNDTFVEHHDAVAHGHGFHLIMRDVDGGGTHAAMKDLRLTHDSAGQSDPLTLTAGKLTRLAIEERANAEK